jgi:hypothetical protein
MPDPERPPSAAPLSPTEVKPLEAVWSIGLYHGADPLTLRPMGPGDGVVNPVLTASHVTDIDCGFVADPVHVTVDGVHHLFFEVWNRSRHCGEIALAVSRDALTWTYREVVLREPFHLSYPCVFRHDDVFYMIPETRAAQGIRLYRAEAFPHRWTLAGELLKGDFADATPIHHDGLWWIFAQRGLDELRLLWSKHLTAGWQDHVASPIVAGNRRLSRPAGPLVVLDDRILRFAQDAWPHYGSRVRAVGIRDWSADAYAEEEVIESPILQASGEGWNAQGMHHVDFIRRGDADWLAVVDGYTLGSKPPGRS